MCRETGNPDCNMKYPRVQMWTTKLPPRGLGLCEQVDRSRLLGPCRPSRWRSSVALQESRMTLIPCAMSCSASIFYPTECLVPSPRRKKLGNYKLELCQETLPYLFRHHKLHSQPIFALLWLPRNWKSNILRIFHMYFMCLPFPCLCINFNSIFYVFNIWINFVSFGWFF